MPAALHPWIATFAVILVFAGLLLRRGAAVDLIFLGGLMCVVLTGVITPEQAFRGFANPAVITIGGLLAVAAGLRCSGVLDWTGRKLLGTIETEQEAMVRLSVVLIVSSAFLLNTAVVAMMMPVVVNWCRQRGIAASKLLIPVSYLTILGGVCTLVGTSTTLVAQSKLAQIQQEFSTRLNLENQPERDFLSQLQPMSLFELAYVGVPCAVVGAVLLYVFGRRLLPNRTDMIEQLDDHRREYLVEMLVQPDCNLIGSTIEQAGLRHLPGLFLIEIDRDGEIITPVTPDDVLHGDDRLVFTGIVATIVDLERIPGLVPAADMNYELTTSQVGRRHLTEVVLSRTFPLIGRTVRSADFRRRYNAAVVAVHRNGERVTNKIGDIVLEASDTLLLQTRTEFATAYRNSRDFYLVSSVEGVEPRRHDKLPLAFALLGVLIVWLVATSFFRQWGWLPGLASTATAAISIAGLMVVTRCMSLSEARHAIDLQMLITIAAALGLASALTSSGAAANIASFMVTQVGQQPFLLLLCIYLLAVVMTETVTNNAVAAMLLPIAVEVAWASQVSPRPYVIAITLAASLSFLTPIGYQTNLMVMGPGGYRTSDYLRCGTPLALAVGITAMILIPIAWPF